ncbi:MULTISPECIES: hypothetical protein [Streptomyces]|nr:hypothetical protein [Streptomyces griseus]SEE26479.1 hypothetical protein SAMN04490359_2449 [Streptomyces griseus]SQA27281.1 Uncharacterised protein [Streptomyces griseus]
MPWAVALRPRHSVDRLPSPQYTDDHIVRRGYVVDFAGHAGGAGLPRSWVFFADREPAVVFGRAARMSGYDVSHYAVLEAARENRWNERASTDVVTLYVKGGSDLRNHTAERLLLERWVRGCRPDSASYEAPD